MSSFVVVLFFVPVLLMAAGAVALVAVLARRPAPAPSEAAEAARRHALAVNAAAWFVLALLALLANLLIRVLSSLYRPDPSIDRLATTLVPALSGLLFLAVHAIGELSWPRPSGTVRRAALIPRQLSDAVPTWLHRVTWGWATALTATLVIMGITADDGRQFSAEVDGVLSVTSPFPGWFYGVPLLVGTALVLAATEGALRLVARRPAVVDADPAYDAASRRLSAHRVLRGAQLVLALTLAWILVFGGAAIVNAQLMALGSSLCALGLVVGVSGLVLAIIPARPAVQSRPFTPPAGFTPPGPVLGPGLAPLSGPAPATVGAIETPTAL